MGLELVIVFVLLGVLVGVMAGLLGIGGGGILVPVLTSIFIYQGIPEESVVHIALGTSMACIIFTSCSSMRAHYANGNVIIPLAKTMALGIIVGTFAATFLAAYLSAKVLAIFFAVFMAYVSLQMFFSVKVSNATTEINNNELRAVSLGIGTISALVSIGGGSLTVPYLTWRGVDIKQAIGTSAVLGFAISIAGTLGYLVNGLQEAPASEYTFGYVHLPALALVAITSYFFAPLGAKLTQKLPVKILKRVFGVLLMLLSLKMAYTFL